MISRKKGMLSPDFLVPNVGLLLSILLVEGLYTTWIRPRAEELLLERKAWLSQGAGGSVKLQERHLALLIKLDGRLSTLHQCIFDLCGLLLSAREGLNE